MRSKDYHKELWKDYFSLSESSPSGLVWRVDRGNGKTFVGSVAGTVSKSGHWKVELKGKTIQVLTL